MIEPMWWIVSLYLALVMVLLLASLRPRAYEGAVSQFQASVGLELLAETREPMRRRMLADRRSGLGGGAVGILVSALIIRTQTADPGGLEAMFMVAGAFAGPAVAVAVRTLLSAKPPADERVRYARAQAVGLNDYISVAERWLARAPAVIALLFFAAWGFGVWLNLVPKSTTPALIGGVVLLIGAVLLLLIFEISARRIVAMANQVGSPEELVWEDAIRSKTVRDISSAPALVGLYAIAHSLPSLFGEDTAAPFLGWIGMAAFAGTLIVLVIVATLRPERYFLRRLWPELATTNGKPYGADAADKPYGSDAEG